MQTSWQRKLAFVWNGMLDVIYPPVCFVCGVRWLEPMCPVCQRDMHPILPPFCDRCGVPVEGGHSVCERCATTDPPFDWSQALGQYQGTLRRAIHRLKYEGRTALAEPLGMLLARSLDVPASPLLSEKHPGFDAVVPVPLHPFRLRQRGFNQAELLARVVARERGWPLDGRGLQRIRPTRTQTHLTLDARRANIEGAFATRTPLSFERKSVLLVDDVLTTSATLAECARVARNAGATRVCVVALARGS
jgi:ComF family protein